MGGGGAGDEEKGDLQERGDGVGSPLQKNLKDIDLSLK